MVQLLARIISLRRVLEANPGRSHGSADTLPLRQSANYISIISYTNLSPGIHFRSSSLNSSTNTLYILVGVLIDDFETEYMGRVCWPNEQMHVFILDLPWLLLGNRPKKCVYPYPLAINTLFPCTPANTPKQQRRHLGVMAHHHTHTHISRYGL